MSTASPAPPTDRDVYSISRLNSEIRAVLEGSFPLLWVAGEISNLAKPRSGHLYFTLKDDHAQVRCALFRAKRNLLRFEPADGIQVLARARVSFYEPRGDFQLIVEHLEPAGSGTAQQAFEALKLRLQAEGLFATGRKRPLPAFPQRLGVITSPSGAAIRDVLQVLRRRARYLPVTIYPAQVQGAAAAETLREALALALTRADCDVLLLTRGGGSLEDLAAFNDEGLARAIAAARIPVVSAVGHEIDITIADLVADRRAPTPSAAAELIAPDSAALVQTIVRYRQRLDSAQRRRLRADQRLFYGLGGRLQRAAPRNRVRQAQQRLDSLDLRLGRAMQGRLAGHRDRLLTLDRRLRAGSPARRLATLRDRLATLPERLERAWTRGAVWRRERLATSARQLDTVSPLATLQRGYSVLRRPPDGTLVGSVVGVARGDRLEALLADGRLRVTVDAVSGRGLQDSGDGPDDD